MSERAAVLWGGLLVGLAPWIAGVLATYAYPTLPRVEVWRVAGTVAMCMWTPACVLAALLFVGRK